MGLKFGSQSIPTAKPGFFFPGRLPRIPVPPGRIECSCMCQTPLHKIARRQVKYHGRNLVHEFCVRLSSRPHISTSPDQSSHTIFVVPWAVDVWGAIEITMERDGLVHIRLYLERWTLARQGCVV